MSKVYLVGTPIGNLEDITFRAVRVLNEVDFIACEDTRHSSILLRAYEIKKPTFSYHKFNEKSASDHIISLVNEGKSVAVISDAGMPAISDPGATLIEKLIEKGIEYEIIPGVSATTTAVVGSGLDTSAFVFGGFMPDKKTERVALLNRLASSECTIMLYSADHDLKNDLNDCAATLGPRRVVVANDLTKKFEHYYRGVLGEIEIENPRGEFVILIEGSSLASSLNDLTIPQHVEHYLATGVSRMEALKLVAKDRNISKSTVYAQCEKNKE